MDTIVLKYNSRNHIAKKTLDYVLSLGFFEIANYNAFAESDDDIIKGRIYSAKDADDLIKKCVIFNPIGC